MKHFKRLFSYLVALTMVLSLAAFAGVNVHADGTTGSSLTVTNTGKTTHTFVLYQIFTGDYSEKTENDKTTKTLSNVKWGSDVTYAVKTDFGDATEKASTLSSASDAQNFAKALVTKDNGSYKYLKNVDSLNVASGKYHTFNVASGYYLVIDTTDLSGKQDAVSNYIVEVVGKTTVNAKLDVPASEKKVKENTKNVEGNDDTRLPGVLVGDKYNDVADYDIGDEVPFELIGSLPSNYSDYTTYYYQFTDTMDKGLTFNSNSVKVSYMNSSDTGWQIIASTNYTVNANKDGHGFTVTFGNKENGYLKSIDKITSSSKIKVDFTATLNGQAEIGLSGNVNRSYLTFSNDMNSEGHGQTTEDKVIVFTYTLNITKVDADTTNGTKKLPGAQFKLKNEAGKWLHQDENGLNSWGTEDDATVFTSDANGLITIKGLDSGTYYAKETKAPEGYNLDSIEKKMKIEAATSNNQTWSGVASDALTSITLNETKDSGSIEAGTVSGKITNTHGSNLPSTGGMGTTLLYAAGGILVACAAAYVIINRKKSAKK